MSIEYPLLRLCPKHIQGAIKDKKDFLKVSKKADLQMIFLKCHLIDKQGIKYKISQAKLASKVFILPFIYTDSLYWVDIEVEEVEKLTLEDIKNELILSIKKYRKLKMIREDYINAIEKAITIEEVINLVEIYP